MNNSCMKRRHKLPIWAWFPGALERWQTEAGWITRRGNQYLRKLLVQGAWSVIRYAHRSDDRLSRRARQLIERHGKQVAAVAVANKLARIIWAMSYHQYVCPVRISTQSGH